MQGPIVKEDNFPLLQFQMQMLSLRCVDWDLLRIQLIVVGVNHRFMGRGNDLQATIDR